MRLQTYIFLNVVLVLQLVFGEIWEFGENVQTSSIIAHHQGDISLLEKTKSIVLAVPDCEEIDYVRVEVNNLISNPAVHFDKLTQTVTISYKPLQFSISTYDVVAKAKKKQACAAQMDTLELVYGK